MLRFFYHPLLLLLSLITWGCVFMVLFVVNGNDIYNLVGWEVFEAYMVHIWFVGSNPEGLWGSPWLWDTHMIWKHPLLILQIIFFFFTSESTWVLEFHPCFWVDEWNPTQKFGPPIKNWSLSSLPDVRKVLVAGASSSCQLIPLTLVGKMTWLRAVVVEESLLTLLVGVINALSLSGN